jgi:twinkle protein
MADIGEVKRQLAQRAEAVAAMLLPRGKRQGSEWRAGNIGGDAGDSLGVHLTGEKAGVWRDFAGDRGGDLIDLWAAAKGISLVDAYVEAKSYLGLTDYSFEGRQKKTYRKPSPARGTQKLSDQGPALTYLMSGRGLSLETIQAYRLAQRQDPKHGWQIVFPFKRNDELLNVKYLALERTADGKKIISFEGECELCLFGWQAIPEDARSVVITEGELDALSWFQMGYPALSVPNGAKSDKWIETEFEHLERFETVYLSFDGDKDGQDAIPKLVERLGRHRVRVVTLPHKDANECIQKGTLKAEFDHAYSCAQTADPAELKNARLFFDEVVEGFYPRGGVEPGFVTPFAGLMDKVRFRPGELSIWTGVNGHGKSMILSQVLLAAAEQGERACVAPTEMPARRWLMRQVKQATGHAIPPVDLITAYHRWAGEWLWIFNVKGSSKAQRILDVFEYAWKRYDITQFVVDSLMKMGFEEDDYNGQKKFTEQLADFTITTNTHVHLVCHARKGSSEKEIVGKMDVKGTGAITDLASNVFVMWRNKVKEEAMMRAESDIYAGVDQQTLESPDAMFICDKQRNGEWEKRFPLWYDRETIQYRESLHSSPYVYVGGEIEERQESSSEFANVDLNDWTN